jgi:hypothetical protein
MQGSLEDRLWPKVRADVSGCWVWLAATTSGGYGQVQVNGGRRVAHRVVYELMVGAVPVGLELDHLCRNRPCVNPTHLEPVTHSENCRRSPLMGRVNRSKTRCPAGHPYAEQNTYVRRNGHRMCRTCTISRKRRYRAAATLAGTPLR